MCSLSVLWEAPFMVALLLGDKNAEVLSNLCMDRAWEDTDIDVINGVHGGPTVVCWWQGGYQTMRIRKVVGTIVCHI